MDGKSVLTVRFTVQMLGSALRHFFVKHSLTTDRVVVAVSGGVDSTALLVAMAGLRADGWRVAAAHVNHHLRGAESEADEGFVRDLCGGLEIPLDVVDGTLDPARVAARGIEAAAREIRYAKLLEIRTQRAAAFVATAHQKNDQAETVLMRLLHGAGMSGLRAIRPVREDGVIRPLLDVRRDEIELWLRERGITPRSDSSNADPRFLRNRLRPLLADPLHVDNLAALAADAQEQWPILEREIDAAERGAVDVAGETALFRHLPDSLWIAAELLRRQIRRLDPDARDFDATRIATGASSIRRLSVTGSLELIRTAEGLLLRRRAAPAGSTPPFELAVKPGERACIEPLGLTFRVEPVDAEPGHRGRQIIQLPEGSEPAFIVRNRRDGDRFHPLGLGGSKKLKDFLIDRKIAADRRDRLPLLLWNDAIVWIAGVEVSDRFRVTSPHGALYEVWLEGSGESDDDGNQSGVHG